MTTDVDSYNDQIRSLDLIYVREAGRSIQARLFPRPVQVPKANGTIGDGPVPYPLPVGLNYQPDNGTSYSLVFVSTRTITQVGSEVNESGWLVPMGCFEMDGSAAPGYVLVTRTDAGSDNFSYPFNFSLGMSHHVSYVGEKTQLGYADTCALVALFRAISGAEILDPEEGG